jgi:PAS domain S-box-containing protein
MMNRQEHTFRSAVIGLGVMFSLVLCVITAGLLAQGHSDALTRSQEYVGRTATDTLATVNRNLVSVDMTLAEIGRWITSKQHENGGLALNAALHDTGLQRLMLFALHQNMMLSDIAVIDDAGHVLVGAKATTSRLGMDLPQPFFKSLQAQPFPALQISTPVHNAVTSAWVLYLARSMPLADGKRAVIVAEVQVPLLANLMSSGPEEDKLWIALENDAGSLLASSPDADTLTGRTMRPVLSESTEAAMVMEGRLTDDASMVSVHRTLYPGVLMAVGQPIDVALTDWHAKRNTIMVVTLVLLAMTGAATAMALRYLEKVSQVREMIADTNATLVKSNDQLARSLSLLKATLESTPDAVVVVDRDNHIKLYNSRFITTMKVPESLLASGNLKATRTIITSQVSNTETYFKGAIEAYASLTSETRDVIMFKDGRVFERRSMPQRLNGETIGRVWCYRDITDRREPEHRVRQAPPASTQT